jgi:hypothetical protein
MPWSIKRKTNAWDLSTAPERHKGLGMNLKAARLSKGAMLRGAKAITSASSSGFAPNICMTEGSEKVSGQLT